jgi:hypothetical protein
MHMTFGIRTHTQGRKTNSRHTNEILGYHYQLRRIQVWQRLQLLAPKMSFTMNDERRTRTGAMSNENEVRLPQQVCRRLQVKALSELFVPYEPLMTVYQHKSHLFHQTTLKERKKKKDGLRG